MSTKMHHGYRLADGTDLFEFIETLRAVMDPIRDRLDADALMDRAVTLVVNADRQGLPRPEHPLYEALQRYDDEQEKANPAHRWHDPHHFGLAFGRDPGTGRILALLFTDRNDFVEAWEGLPQVEPYGYWNNTDRPEGVSVAGWDERRDAWERVDFLDRTPVGRSLTFDLRPDPPGDIGMAMMVHEHRTGRWGATTVDEPREAARLALLRSAAPSLGVVARSVAVSLIVDEARDQGLLDENDPYSLISLVMRVPREHRDVIDACREALEARSAATLETGLPGADPVEYAIHGVRLLAEADRENPSARAFPLDLTAARAAAAERLSQTAADSGC